MSEEESDHARIAVLENRVGHLEQEQDRHRDDLAEEIKSLKHENDRGWKALKESVDNIVAELSTYRRNHSFSRGAIWCLSAIAAVLLFFHEDAAALFEFLARITGGSP